MPRPLTTTQEPQEILDAIPVLNNWVRGALVGLALGLTAVFSVAVYLNPYKGDGTARTMETHRQLGLPPCSFYAVTRLPCPACGMTTSFALLVRGDVLHSLRANAVGTLLAAFCLLLVPWSLASVVCRRTLFIRSVERTLMVVVITFLGLMLLRWGIVLGLAWATGTRFGG